MKVASLLAEYFYTHKRLDLPGIGSFLLDPGSYKDPESVKQGRIQYAEGISFENNPGINDTSDLISFIASSTGKIRALASADLDSHLENARQFLNIGKPFLFEGIGSLTRVRGGGFSFIPGHTIPEKIKETVSWEAAPGSSSEEPVTGFKNIFYGPKAKTNNRKTLGILLLLLGLGLALWGGYTIYKKTIAGRNKKPGDVVSLQEVTPEKTIPAPVAKDTVITSATVVAGTYRFVVEKADSLRGMNRYNALKGYGLPVQMRTHDSIQYEIFFVLQAGPSDTARMLDSLRQLYSPVGGKAYIGK